MKTGTQVVLERRVGEVIMEAKNPHKLRLRLNNKEALTTPESTVRQNRQNSSSLISTTPRSALCL